MLPDIVYRVAPALQSPYRLEDNTVPNSLRLDLFLPQGDTLTRRPAVIFAHSGAFLQGNRQHDDMMAFCDSLARKGYVTATIDYRQGFEIFSNNTPMHATRAVYRGFQDGRAAVRYLRAHADDFGIDSSRIYFAGSSAGAFIALHLLYMDRPQERPPETFQMDYWDPLYGNQTAPDLGGFDIGWNLGVRGTPDAAVSLWGAVKDTLLIDEDDLQPLYLAHGEADPVVPFTQGHPFGYPLFPEVQGSALIAQRLTHLNAANFETYFVPGAGHEFYGTSNGSWTNGSGGNAYWDTLVVRITQFLWRQHKPTAAFSFSVQDSFTVAFTNQSTDLRRCTWDFGDGALSHELHPVHTFPGAGNYRVRLYVENAIQSWDTLSQVVSLQPLALAENRERVPEPVVEVFPNPFNLSTRIHFVLQQAQEVHLEIFNLRGQRIRSLLHRRLAPGRYTVLWNGCDASGRPVASGVYLCRLKGTSGSSFTGRVILLK